MKNESPLLIGKSDDIAIFTSEPSGFMNMVDDYHLLREKTYGYVDNKGVINIIGEYKKLSEDYAFTIRIAKEALNG